LALVAVTGRTDDAADVALIRVTVFAAKLLTQTEVPAEVTANGAEPCACPATRIGAPDSFPVPVSIRLTVPPSASPAKT
jgi:hypothetical protein